MPLCLAVHRDESKGDALGDGGGGAACRAYSGPHGSPEVPSSWQTRTACTPKSVFTLLCARCLHVPACATHLRCLTDPPRIVTSGLRHGAAQVLEPAHAALRARRLELHTRRERLPPYGAHLTVRHEAGRTYIPAGRGPYVVAVSL